MSGKEELLATFDDTWSHRWESFESTLKDVTDDEANYQSVIYSDTTPYPNEPPNGTILWHLVHLAQCYRHYTGIIIERPLRPVEPEPPQASTVAEAIDTLKHIRAEFREAVSNLKDDELQEKVFNNESLQEFIRTRIRHEVWHIAQISVARRLFRMRSK